jgi:hypothetical protein
MLKDMVALYGLGLTNKQTVYRINISFHVREKRILKLAIAFYY